jgi:alpha-N-arabinofuranosidase
LTAQILNKDMAMRKTLAPFVVFVGLAISASAAEIHVALSGRDSHPGTPAAPLRTIQRAADLALPGDIITVHAGVYRERIAPPRGGSSETERIVYQAAPGEKVEIAGSEIVKGWVKAAGDTWSVRIPNGFFGAFNPYRELIHGDWFSPTPKDRAYHRGSVYLNGDWLMEAAKQEEVLGAADEKNPLWYAVVDADQTTIWAQFKNVDPNKETVEINVRPTVFYPDKPFINFITLRGFTLRQAASNWAPPTAEQTGLVGTHWSRGWIIEDNVVEYSKCVGIALGKYGDAFDNKDTESAEGYVGTINRALAFGWNKGTVGGHLVRRNLIAYCEQAGVVGSMGCAFSTVTDNTIHDIHIRRLFSGAEMAGIKFHGAVDVQIVNNHISRSNMGVWLDWMAQGAQVRNNLMHDNLLDIFLEVDHGPILVSNNILLSGTSLLMNSSGVAFAHNLFGGKMDVIPYDARLTPYHPPHSTFVAGLHDNPGGDIRFLNNLYVLGGNARQYDEALLPVVMAGNVYTKGPNAPLAEDRSKRFGGLSEALKAKLQSHREDGALDKRDFDAGVKLSVEKDGVYLEIAMDRGWLSEQKRSPVTTRLLGRVLIPDLPFENPDGSQVSVDKDYFGKPRNLANPSPGPFEIAAGGMQRIKVWGGK